MATKSMKADILQCKGKDDEWRTRVRLSDKLAVAHMLIVRTSASTIQKQSRLPVATPDYACIQVHQE